MAPAWNKQSFTPTGKIVLNKSNKYDHLRVIYVSCHEKSHKKTAI